MCVMFFHANKYYKVIGDGEGIVHPQVNALIKTMESFTAAAAINPVCLYLK